jgi:hypothetical protein
MVLVQAVPRVHVCVFVLFVIGIIEKGGAGWCVDRSPDFLGYLYGLFWIW